MLIGQANKNNSYLFLHNFQRQELLSTPNIEHQDTSDWLTAQYKTFLPTSNSLILILY